jgi:hypothetical protein
MTSNRVRKGRGVSNKALARESRAGSIGQRATRQKEGELVRYSSERERGDMSEGEKRERRKERGKPNGSRQRGRGKQVRGKKRRERWEH